MSTYRVGIDIGGTFTNAARQGSLQRVRLRRRMPMPTSFRLIWGTTAKVGLI